MELGRGPCKHKPCGRVAAGLEKWPGKELRIGADVPHPVGRKEGSGSGVIGTVLAGAVGRNLRIDDAWRLRSGRLSLAGDCACDQGAGRKACYACRDRSAVV